MTYPELLTPEEKLASAKERLAIPTITCICGSTRFMTEMGEADLQLTADGHIVVMPGCDMKSPHPRWADPVEAEALKSRLDGLHRAKIRLADEVLVVGDYIGGNTNAAIAHWLGITSNSVAEVLAAAYRRLGAADRIACQGLTAVAV